MILNMYSVRDSGTSAFGTPNFFVNDGHAIRTISDEVNRQDPQNLFNKHPQDFELFHLGTFDTDTGLFVTNPPKSVQPLRNLIKSVQ